MKKKDFVGYHVCFIHSNTSMQYTENIKVSQYVKLSHLTHFLSVRWHTGD